MKTEKRKISVIVPNYNHALYLRKRIDSILNQDYHNIEVVILDDCSTDGSQDIIKGYNDLRISYHFNERNSGSTFKQWKKGLSLTNGEYIWIAESDDFADLHFLSRSVEAIEMDENIGFVHCNSAIVNDEDKVIGDMADWKNTAFKTDIWSYSFKHEGLFAINNYLGLACTVNNASSVLFRRNAINVDGVLIEFMRYAGDWMVYIGIASNHRVSYIKDTLNYYREHSANASKSANYLLLYERIFCFHKAYRIVARKYQSNIFESAVNDYMGLIYHYLVEQKAFGKMFDIMFGIFKLDIMFFLKLQSRAILNFVAKRN